MTIGRCRSGITEAASLLMLAHIMFFPAACPAAPPQEKGPLRFRVPAGARFEFGGVLGQRIDANLRQWLLTAPYANPGMLDMFRVRDRQPAPDLVPWAGEFVGKYLLSAIQARRMVRSDELDRTVQDVVERLIASQAEDGYLGPFKKSERLLGQWDLWGHEHVMLALMMYHEDARDEPALAACVRAADLICKTYLDGQRRVFDAGSQEMNMAVIHTLGRLYRLTGNDRFLQMVRHIEKDWERAGDYLRTGAAGVPFYRAPRPRWESLHDLQGLVELYRITGDDDYRRAFINHWTSIARFDRHNSGSFSTGEGAIGNPYQNGAIETCCTTAWIALTTDYLQLTGESTAADELEWSTYNAVLAAQHPSGRWWTYDTPMDGVRRASAHSIVFQARPGTPELNCCSVNGPRGLGMLSEWAVLLDSEGPIVNHYGPCRISLQLADKTDVTLKQETNYPAEGSIRITLTLSKPSEFNLRLRIPAWSRRTTTMVNNQPVDGVRPGVYVSLKRLWQSGDTIQLSIDMSPRYWLGECEQAGKASIYHGPLLLAFDPHDNSFDVGQIPTIDLANLTLTPVPADESLGSADPPWPASAATGGRRYISPIVLFDVKAVDGRTVRLCDFATAGAYGNEYRSWLPAANGTTSNDWLTYAPVHPKDEKFTTDPDGRLVASALDGSGEPSRGKLQTAVNIKPASDRRGRADGAVEFNGKDAKLQYEIAGFPREFTVCAWVYVKAFSPKTYQQIFSAWASGSTDPLRVSVMGDQVSARIEAGSLYATPGVKIGTVRWFHVAAVKSGERLDLYIDGKPRESAKTPECTCATSVRNFALGGNPNFSGDEYLNGRIDDFVMYAKALSPDDILRIFESGGE